VPLKSSQDYFEAALAIVGQHGLRVLTIASLCQRLTVTKGSFYHHFSGWDDFVGGLLAYWETEQTERIIDLTSASRDPRARLESLVELASEVPHAAESAIRCWGANDAAVGEAQRRVDASRLEYTAVVLAELLDDDRERARSLAKTTLALFVGLQQISPRLGSSEMKTVLTEYLRGVLGPAFP